MGNEILLGTVSDEALDAMIVSKGFDPQRFYNRREGCKLLAAHGIGTTPKSLAKIAATREDGPEYTILFGEARMSPRALLRWALSQASPLRRSPAVRRPRQDCRPYQRGRAA
jgi:hypothetical protein